MDKYSLVLHAKLLKIDNMARIYLENNEDNYLRLKSK